MIFDPKLYESIINFFHKQTKMIYKKENIFSQIPLKLRAHLRQRSQERILVLSISNSVVAPKVWVAAPMDYNSVAIQIVHCSNFKIQQQVHTTECNYPHQSTTDPAPPSPSCHGPTRAVCRLVCPHAAATPHLLYISYRVWTCNSQENSNTASSVGGR